MRKHSWNKHDEHPHTPLWLQLIQHTAQLMVRGHTNLRKAYERSRREPLRRVAVYRLLADWPINKPDQAQEPMIEIVCAACQTLIGTLDSADYEERDADLIAQAHSYSCTATPEQKEQAFYDIQFRILAKGLEQ